MKKSLFLTHFLSAMLIQRALFMVLAFMSVHCTNSESGPNETQAVSDEADTGTSLPQDSVDSGLTSNDVSLTDDSTTVDVANPDVALNCDGPTLQELGLTRTTSVYIVMQIVRVDTDKRLVYPIFITALGSPIGIDSELTQDNATVTLDGDLIVNILPDDRLAMAGQFVWKEEGRDEVVTPMANCINGFGPLPDINFTLSNGVEIVIHTQFLLEHPE
jgi:hypothetical protein